MANDWYCSSAAYATYTAFATSHAYSVGDIVVPTAPALKAKWVFRCTTAGTSSTEPSWATTNNGTSTSGTATFTHVTGQSAYFWTAAAGDLASLMTNRIAGGDRIFISSDHTETQTTTTTYGSGGGTPSYACAQFLSVTRAGSTPPVVADLTAGASITVSGNTLFVLETAFPSYHFGITYIYTGTNAAGFVVSLAGFKTVYLSGCQIYLNTATTTVRIVNASPGTLTLDNSTLRFGSTSQAVQGSTSAYPFEIVWKQTAGAIAGATIPAVLFAPSSSGNPLMVTCRGVDLSAITGTLVQNATSSGNGGSKFLFDSCKVAAVTRFSITNCVNTRDVVELVNCYDGTNILNERYTPAGTLTTERTITLSGGATDDVGTFAHKLVSTANVDKYVQPFESFWMDVEYTTTGSSKTATVEIISSGTLNNDEIYLDLEYQGTAGSSLASFANSLPATVLSSASAVTTSTATWNSSPATPQKQHLQVTFTPQTAGRVRGIVRLGKASATVYINPQIAIT